MKKIITKKQKDCSGCLFKHVNDIHCEMAFKVTGVDCGKEDIIFVHEEEEPKYRSCRNIVEGSRLIGKYMYYNNDAKVHIIAVYGSGFVTTFNNKVIGYYPWRYAFKHCKLEDGSPIGVKENDIE